MSQAHRAAFVSYTPVWLGAAPRALARWGAWVDSLALLLLALGVRVIGLGGLPFWNDELFTIFWSQLPVGYLLGAGAHTETIPPAYYMFMHGWIAMFGDSGWAVHVPSLVVSSVTVPVVYLAARSLFDRPTALLAGVLAAVNPFLVLYGQEARPYAMLALADGLAFWALAVYFRLRAQHGARLWPWLVLFVVAVSAGVFLHYTSVLFLVACFLVVGLELAIGGAESPGPFLMWLGLGAATALCVAYPLLLALGLTHSASLTWIPRLSPALAENFFMSVALDPQAPAGWLGWACCGGLAAVAAAGAWWLRLGRTPLLLLVVLPLLFGGLLFTASAMRPILIPRIGIFLVIPLSILLARCVVVQKSLALRGVAAVVLLAAWVVPLSLYFVAPDKEDWNTAAKIAMTQPVCNGPLMYVGSSGLGLIYYQPALANRPLYALALGVAQGHLTRLNLASEQANILQATYLHATELYLRDAPAFVAAHPHTMLVLRPPFAQVLNMLPRPAALGELHGRLLVACY